MDLTIFIMLIVVAFIMYYLMSSIQSLIQEVREVKNKCIITNNVNKSDFKIETPDPAEVMTKNVIQTFMNLKDIFNKQ
jgi:hypothetical protein